MSDVTHQCMIPALPGSSVPSPVAMHARGRHDSIGILDMVASSVTSPSVMSRIL